MNRDDDQNEGEGSRTAAHRYNEDLREFIAEDRVDDAARAAADDLDGPEGPSLRAAEERAAHTGHMTLRDRLRSLYHRARNALSRHKPAPQPR